MILLININPVKRQSGSQSGHSLYYDKISSNIEGFSPVETNLAFVLLCPIMLNAEKYLLRVPQGSPIRGDNSQPPNDLY